MGSPELGVLVLKAEVVSTEAFFLAMRNAHSEDGFTLIELVPRARPTFRSPTSGWFVRYGGAYPRLRAQSIRSPPPVMDDEVDTPPLSGRGLEEQGEPLSQVTVPRAWWVRRASSRRTRLVSLRLAAVALLGVGLFVISYVLAVRTVSGQALGNAALAGRGVILARGTIGAEGILAPIGVVSLGAGIIVLMAIAVVRRRPRLALATAVMVGATSLISELFKSLVLPRQNLVSAATYYQHNSFPSGHATAALAVAAGLIMVSPRRLRGTVGIVGAIYASLVGYSTLLSGWHRPSDVAGSATLVLAFAAMSAAALVWWRGSGSSLPPVPRQGPPLAAVALLSAGVGLLLAGLLGLAGPLEALSARLSLTGPLEDASFIAMSTASIGASLLSLGLLVLGLHGVQLDAP